ncbi:MAG: hypothetical protein Q8K78_12630 [Planctomycetaceae bacterium]|nr:hypothetical protein [Planctomycetaceae bacterium]
MSHARLQTDCPPRGVNDIAATLGRLNELESELQAMRSTDAASPAPVRSAEWRVVVVVAAVLGLAECVFHFGKHALSKDVEHLQSFGELAESFAETPATGPKVLFLGNSLTRYGVDETVVSNTLRETAGIVPMPLKIVPDNTAVADWSYVYRNQFSTPARAPQLLVIGFEGGHLRDAPSRHPDRLAQYYCSWKDWPELCARDLPDFESRAAFLLEACSSMVGNRDRVTRRALDTLIPGYREGMDRINASLKGHGPATIAPTYQRLRTLIDTAREQQVQVVLAAMPVPERYEFDAELLAVVKETRVQLIDLRHIDGLEPAMFFDGLHMDAAGAKLYSAALAKQLATIVGERGIATADLPVR